MLLIHPFHLQNNEGSLPVKRLQVMLCQLLIRELNLTVLLTKHYRRTVNPGDRLSARVSVVRTEEPLRTHFITHVRTSQFLYELLIFMLITLDLLFVFLLKT